MATQLAEAPVELIDTGQDVGDGGSAFIERDYEGEARAHGWVPADEFKGDKSRCVDAKTFVERADEVMPLLRKQNKEFRGKIDFLERQIKKVMKSEQGAYEQALADVKAKMENAVVTGNVEAFNKLDKQADDLRKGMVNDTPQADQQKEAVRAFAEWRGENEWYDLGGQAGAEKEERLKRAEFDRQVELNEDKAREMAPADFIAHIGELVDAKYPAFKTPRPKATESVAGVTRKGNGNTAKTGANLPAEAKAQAKRFHSQGIYKGTLAEAYDKYAQRYDWN